MSFYKGFVAKMINTNENIWEVVLVSYIDTKSDINMNTAFHHLGHVRATFVPTEIIKNFKPGHTLKVKRTFYENTRTESWEAI